MKTTGTRRDKEVTEAKGRRSGEDRITRSPLSPPLAQPRQDHTLLEAIMAATDVMLVYLDRDFNVLRVNDSYATACGMRAEEMIGKNHFTLCPHPANEAILRQVRDTGQPVFFKDKPYEFPNQAEWGSTYWDWRLAPVKDGDGSVLGLLFSLRETTNCKRAELALGESEERFRRLAETCTDLTARKNFEETVLRAKREWERTFDAVPDLIAIIDKNHRVVRANLALATRLGRTPGELVGMRCFTCLHGTCGPPVVCPHALTMRDGQEHTAELHEKLLGGDFLVTTTPLFDAAGVMTGSVHVSRDISERKKAEAKIRALNEKLQESVTQLEEVNQELDRSNQDLQQFAYITSHDLQGPLHTVASFLQLLERRCGDRLDEKAVAYINHAVDGAAYMQQLLADLLAFSRVGGGTLNLRPVPLGAVVDRVIFNLQKAIADHGAEVVIAGELPMVVADESQMLHLLQNLIANAIKFHGESPPRVETFAVQRQGEWIICVRDNGIGIDPRFTERIFLIFQRLHKREEYSGTGIGLAICKKIVERHGGRIWVESSPGQGATFCFSLPVRSAPDVA